MQLDVLAFGAHPDDVELSCSGTLIKLVEAGKKVGIVDLTQGEMGTRGSAQLRLEEAQRAADIMGLSARENLNLGDAQFEVNQENKLKVIQVIRKYRPTMIFMKLAEKNWVGVWTLPQRKSVSLEYSLFIFLYYLIMGLQV